MKKIVDYFIPNLVKDNPENHRKYRLVVSIIIITALFDLNYVGISSLVGLDEGIKFMLIVFAGHAIFPFLIRAGFSHVLVTNFYVVFGVFGIVGCTYFSGGFDSIVIIWLASTPIVALLMAGKRTGFSWMIINTLIVIIFGALSKEGFVFPNSINPDWDNMFLTNTLTGLIIIIFVVSLVFENGKNTALKELASKTALLAEEKKKNALYAVSQDIHDNVGQRLFLTRLSLSSLNLKTNKNEDKMNHTIDMLDHAIDELRNISHTINNENNSDFDLLKAIKTDLSTIEGIGSHTTQLNIIGQASNLNPTTSITLYRIGQELINNILKHAKASAISVEIEFSENQISLQIEDDGIGMTNDQKDLEGQGLRTIKERIEKINGTFESKSLDSKGMSFKVSAASYV